MLGKKLMIMGAGIYQVPLIQKAQSLGIETLVVSIPGNYPGIAMADKFYPVDTRDYEKILEIAQKEQIDGICTSGTDVAVRAIGYVCDKMNLCGITEESAKCVTDKFLMKKAFAKGNVSTAEFKKVFSYEEAEQAAERMGYPVVVKAVDSSGSRGIIKVNHIDELKGAYESSHSLSRMEYVLVEEFIDAEEIGIDAYVGEKGIEVFFLHKKFVHDCDGTSVPIGHQFPYYLNDRLYAELYKQTERAVHALGMKNCPLNADVFIKGDKVWMIEIGGRTGATCIPELISIYQGYDWYEKIIEAALGKSVEFFSNQENSCMAKLIFSPRQGKVTGLDQEGLRALNKEGVWWHIDVKEGDCINRMKNGTDRIGHVIVQTSDESVLDRYVARLRECIWIDGENLEKIYEGIEQKFLR